MHKTKKIANKLINKFLSYQDHNKLIINLLALDPQYQDQQVMNIDTTFTSVKHGNAHPHIITWHHISSKYFLYFIKKRMINKIFGGNMVSYYYVWMSIAMFH